MVLSCVFRRSNHFTGAPSRAPAALTLRARMSATKMPLTAGKYLSRVYVRDGWPFARRCRSTLMVARMRNICLPEHLPTPGNHSRGHLPPYLTPILIPNRSLALITSTLTLTLITPTVTLNSITQTLTLTRGQMSALVISGAQMSRGGAIVTVTWSHTYMAAATAARSKHCASTDDVIIMAAEASSTNVRVSNAGCLPDPRPSPKISIADIYPRVPDHYIKVNVKCAILHEECRRGAHLPSLGREPE